MTVIDDGRGRRVLGGRGFVRLGEGFTTRDR